MKLKIEKGHENYSAKIVKLPELTEAHGLDKLKAVRIDGYNVLVGVDSTPGTLGVFFPPECAINGEFLRENNLFRHSQLNANESVKGYFDDTGRVKAIKIRGNYSEGYFAPLESLNYLGEGYKALAEGGEFTHIGDREICRKNFVKSDKQGEVGEPRQKAEKRDTLLFRQHESTVNIFRAMASVKLNKLTSITIKLHGQSIRVGRVWHQRQLSKWQQFLSPWLARIGAAFSEGKYNDFTGSRRMVTSRNWVGEGKFAEAGKIFQGKLLDGEIIYGELIGWDGAKPLQAGYTYSLKPGENEIVVYRIAMTDKQGNVRDMPWDYVKLRCQELDVKHVEEVYYGDLSSFASSTEELEAKLVALLNKPSTRSTTEWKAVEEGVVLQQYGAGISYYLKARSPEFLQFETKQADQGVGNEEDA